MAKPELVRSDVLAKAIQEGDRLDRTGRQRVKQTLVRDGKVRVAYSVRGARGGSITVFEEGETVTIWRPPSAS